MPGEIVSLCGSISTAEHRRVVSETTSRSQVKQRLTETSAHVLAEQDAPPATSSSPCKSIPSAHLPCVVWTAAPCRVAASWVSASSASSCATRADLTPEEAHVPVNPEASNSVRAQEGGQGSKHLPLRPASTIVLAHPPSILPLLERLSYFRLPFVHARLIRRARQILLELVSGGGPMSARLPSYLLDVKAGVPCLRQVEPVVCVLNARLGALCTLPSQRRDLCS